MYDALKDIERLISFNEYQVKKFICLTDKKYYAEATHKGHAGSVTAKEGTRYKKGTKITPSWIGKWKNKTRNKSIHIGANLFFQWIKGMAGMLFQSRYDGTTRFRLFPSVLPMNTTLLPHPATPQAWDAISK